MAAVGDPIAVPIVVAIGGLSIASSGLASLALVRSVPTTDLAHPARRAARARG